MASSSKPSRKHWKKTMKLKEWYSELEQDHLPPPQINRLPSSLISMILMKLDPLDILFGAQFVCSSWYEICKDPFMWKHIDKIRINAITERLDFGDKYRIYRRDLLNTGVDFNEIVQHVIDRCCGELIELVMCACYIPYSTDRCAKLRCLRLSNFGGLGRMCAPNDGCYCYLPTRCSDDRALAIAANVPGLHHLVLAYDPITNIGLQAILDGCSHLVSLDIRRCPSINLDDDLEKRCEQIQDFCGPS